MHPLAAIAGWAFEMPVVNFVAYTPSLNGEKQRAANLFYFLEQMNFSLFMGEFVHCRNPGIKAMIQRHNPNATVQVTHGILNVEALNEAQYRGGVSDGTKRIAFVGRLIQLKSPKAAVEALYELPDKYELTVVGGGPQREYVEGAAFNLQCDDRVTMLGMIPHTDVLEVLLASDVLLLTSETESYPTVVFEALACSCAVVAPPVWILPHIEAEYPKLTITHRDGYEGAILDANNGGSELDREFANDHSIARFADSVCQSFVVVGE